jgi:ribosome-associated protein
LATKTKEKKEDGARKTRGTPAKTSAAKGGGKAKSVTARASRGKKAAVRDNTRELALAIARVGLEKRALNVEIIDVQGKVDYADYVVVLSGRSDRQVAALAGNIQEELAKTRGTRCLSIEGLPHGRWVLMDYGDVVVHIFHEDVRGYYDLESLWIDAARVSVE